MPLPLALDEEEDALLAALAPNDAESAMLAFVTDHGLHDALLFTLLRAPAGARVSVQVNSQMGKCDAFMGAKIGELLSCPYVDSSLIVKATGGPWRFALVCQACPWLQCTYEDDDVIDRLIEYFNKEMIRFPRVSRRCCVRSTCCDRHMRRLVSELTHCLRTIAGCG